MITSENAFALINELQLYQSESVSSLLHEMRDYQMELVIQNEELHRTQEEERKRIAFELHDDLGQSLVVLILRLRNAQARATATHPELKSECEQMSRLASGMLDTVRRISDGLTPCSLDEFSLTDSLRILIDDFNQSAGLSISMEIENMDTLFSTMAQVAIYRIFQEALTNAVKHALTAHISIKARKAKGAVLFQIQDDGVGFDMKETKSALVNGRSGMGLISMEDRVVMLKGRFKLASRLSEGTKISFRIPYEPTIEAKQVKPFEFGYPMCESEAYEKIKLNPRSPTGTTN